MVKPVFTFPGVNARFPFPGVKARFTFPEGKGEVHIS
jgi:hypothetical protein